MMLHSPIPHVDGSIEAKSEVEPILRNGIVGVGKAAGIALEVSSTVWPIPRRDGYPMYIYFFIIKITTTTNAAAPYISRLVQGIPIAEVQGSAPTAPGFVAKHACSEVEQLVVAFAEPGKNAPERTVPKFAQ